MGRTKNQILDEVTNTYINTQLTPGKTPEHVSIELENMIESELSLENTLRPKRSLFRIPDCLSFDQIAQLMANMYPIIRIACAGANADPAYDLLALYVPNEGTYTTDEDELYRIAIRFNRRLSSNEF